MRTTLATAISVCWLSVSAAYGQELLPPQQRLDSVQRGAVIANPTPPSANMTREQFANIASLVLGLGANTSAPQQVTYSGGTLPDWVNDAVSTAIQIAPLNGGAEGSPVSIAVIQNILAGSTGQALSTPRQGGSPALTGLAPPGSTPPTNWASSEIDRVVAQLINSKGSASPSGPGAQGRYEGSVLGESPGGLEVTGTANLLFDLSGGGLQGSFNFGADGNVFVAGQADADAIGMWLGTGTPSVFMGETVSSASFYAGFFGPNAEQISGDWRLHLGAGDAAGSFITERTSP